MFKMFQTFDSKRYKKHLIYWIGLTLFFSIIWGSYDQNYGRNVMVQLYSLPARLILVYGSLLYLLPLFFSKEKYGLFFIGFFSLLIFCAVFVQRPIMIFIVEGVYLPYNSPSFFRITELMNTVIDVGIAAMIPIGNYFFLLWKESRERIETLVNHKENNLKDVSQDTLVIREGSVNHKVRYADILYIESLRNYLLTKTITKNSTKELKSYGSIAAIEADLPSNSFLRVHRSFLVNLHHLDSYSSKYVVVHGSELPIGRKYKQQVKDTLSNKFSN